MDEDKLRQLSDRAAIEDQLANYCRGLDRMDRALALSAFHPSAKLNYEGMFEGSAPGFMDWVWQAHEAMERHSHQLSQMSLRFPHRDSAISETYVTVTLWTLPDEQGLQRELISRGRYIDHWLRREGQWLIGERLHLCDLHSESVLERGEGVSEGSRRDENDGGVGFWRRFEA